jgi:phosphoribosylaminoimidazole carboxylase PurE protein
MKKFRVAIVMGSQTDLKIMKEAAKTLAQFGVSHDLQIVSAHRTPEAMVHFAQTARGKYQVIIAGAGGAAHLPGMIASLTTLPVIGVPVTTTKLDGLDSLLSIVQMPKGVPVATVAVDNAANAGLLAVRMLAASDDFLTLQLEQFQKQQKNLVKEMNLSLQNSKKKRAPKARSKRR